MNLSVRRMLSGVVGIAAAAALGFLASPARANYTVALNGLTVAPGCGAFMADVLTWSSNIDPNVPVGGTPPPVTYLVYSKPGYFPGGYGGYSLDGSLVNATTFSDNHGEGSYCYIVKSSDSLSGVFNTMGPVCKSFLHNLTRTDGGGQQAGFNELWQWSYNTDVDSLVSLIIYSSATAFSTDANGNLIPDPLAVPIKRVLDQTPRSGELNNCSWTNIDFWDSRDSSGSVVGNGIYIAYFQATDPFGASALGGNKIRYGQISTIPVDIIRFTQASFGGISVSNTLATIKYVITADATIRIVIAKPGRKFTIDAGGQVQSLNAAGTAIDTSTNSVVQVLTFNRKGATSPYSDTWNGTDQNGVAVSTGVYSVGMSATDAFGNRALDLQGNDGPIAGTIPVDRTQSQTSLSVATAVVTGVSVGGTPLSLAGGTQLSTTFSLIQVTMSGPSGIGSNASIVTLTAPNGSVITGTTSINGSTVTFTFPAQNSTGTYTVSAVAKDSVGTTQPPLITTFILGGTAPSVSGINVSGSQISLSGGTTLSSTSVNTIQIYLSGNSGTGSNAPIITLTDPSGSPVAGATTTISGSTVTFSVPPQTSTGTYNLTVVAKDPFGTSGVPITTSFIVPNTSGGGIVTANLLSGVIVYPNPVKVPPVKVDYTLGASANLDIDVFNILGEPVYHVSRAGVGVGLNTEPWTLLNDSGHKVGSGVYLFRIRAAGGGTSAETIKKVMVIQ